MINDNICTQAGDSIFFETTPIVGSARKFTSWQESVTGIEVDTDMSVLVDFDRKFRASYNGGVTYTEWRDLSNDNLIALSAEWDALNAGYNKKLDNASDLKIQFQYTRVGPKNDTDLKLIWLKLNGQIVQREFEFKSVQNTVFRDIIDNNIDVFNMTLNIVNKMHEFGITPEYLTRKDDNLQTLRSDEDFITLWRAVAEFYVILFSHVLRFSKIFWQKDMLGEYLLQKGIFLCNLDNVIEMQLITQNFYDEIRVRGTTEIFKKKGFEYPIGSRKAYRAVDDYQLMPKSPVQIDGVQYQWANQLPFGWLFINQPDGQAWLVSPDTNYHEVLFLGYLSGEIDTQPSEQVIYQATEYSQILKQYDGEYLRLICYSAKCDEFIYNQVNIKDFGWNIGNASPLYKGLDDQYGSIVKAYEKMKDFTVLGKYPWFDGFTPVIIDDYRKFCLAPKVKKAKIFPSACTPITITNASVMPTVVCSLSVTDIAITTAVDLDSEITYTADWTNVGGVPYSSQINISFDGVSWITPDVVYVPNSHSIVYTFNNTVAQAHYLKVQPKCSLTSLGAATTFHFTV